MTEVKHGIEENGCLPEVAIGWVRSEPARQEASVATSVYGKTIGIYYVPILFERLKSQVPAVLDVKLSDTSKKRIHRLFAVASRSTIVNDQQAVSLQHKINPLR